MNHILLFDTDFQHNPYHARLTGRRLKHLLSVNRVKPGDILRAGIANGNTGTAIITEVTPEHIGMDVELTVPPPPPLPVTLLLAIPRPKALRRIIRYVVSAGIKKIFLIRTWRVEKSYFLSHAVTMESLEDDIILGLEQGRDTIMPDIETRGRFKPFAEDEMPEMICGTMALLAHPQAQTQCPFNACGPVTLAVGPEGGFVEYEMETFEKAGFKSVSMGPRPIRTEDAVPALIGRLF